MAPYLLRIWLLAAVVLSLTMATRVAAERVGPVRAELVTDVASIEPGQPFKAGLLLTPDKDWHLYWRNPGDAGLPPSLDWDLPAGFEASGIQWPAPELIESGPLAAYGYHGAALYPVTVTPPGSISPGDTVTLGLRAEWLVCKVACLPGSASVSIELPVAAGASQGGDAELFRQAESKTPLVWPGDWPVQASVSEDRISLDFALPEDPVAIDSVRFFAGSKGVIDHAASQQLTGAESSYRLTLSRSPYSADDPDTVAGVMSVDRAGQRTFYEVVAPVGASASGPIAAASTGDAVSGPLTAVFFAFLGGLILNLMPCVLPVLSLKVMGLVRQAGESRRAALGHGLIFTIGVVASFWVIVGLMLLLQAGGAQLGWGFQLQSPIFVMILAAFMFLLALNMFGVYEISFLAGLAGSSGGSRSGAFVSGVVATVLATPCTAPFMGAAMGYSLTQPVMVSFLIYTFLGLGMAAPYLLLSVFPSWLRFVPRPGKWMETLKQGLGFVLAATVIWLAWVLAAQAGATAVVVLMGVLLLAALAAWIHGRWGGLSAGTSVRWFGRMAAALLLAIGLAGGAAALTKVATSAAGANYGDNNGLPWEPFSADRVEQLRREGKPVFIDFTAAWCLSCQVNEKVALSSTVMRERFASKGIVPLKADWTNRSPEIASALAKYGRNSVPLYVLYKPGQDEPVILPEILTPGIVTEAIETIETTTIDP